MLDPARRVKAFSLKWRLTLLLALATLIALGAAAWIVDWRADSEMQQRFDTALLARAQAIAALAQMEISDGKAETGGLGPGLFSTGAESWYALRCNGTTLARTRAVPPPLLASSGPRFADVRVSHGRTLREVSFRFTPLGADPPADARPGGGTCDLRYALDRAPLDEILGTLDWILLGSLFGVCALVLLLTPLLVRRGLRPLSVLAGAMADIGPDAPGRRLPDSDTRELAPLVARFNDVLARMDAGLAREREFAAGLAHELRTRLAELRALVDVEMHFPSGRDAHELLGEAGSIGAELEATVTALLQLTRIESGLAQVRREAVPLPPLLARAQARHANAAAARGLRIELAASIEPAATIRADAALIDIILDNLIGNAVAYAPVDSVVIVHAHADSLAVINQAPLLREEDLANFGQRFWRKGEGGAGHAGLGLALAAAAARAQRMALRFRLDEAHALHAVLDWGALSGVAA